MFIYIYIFLCVCVCVCKVTNEYSNGNEVGSMNEIFFEKLTLTQIGLIDWRVSKLIIS